MKAALLLLPLAYSVFLASTTSSLLSVPSIEASKSSLTSEKLEAYKQIKGTEDSTLSDIPKKSNIMSKTSEDEEPKTVPNTDGIELPPYLNLGNFDEVTSEMITLVEFFSPYCHHCKEFYPEWERAYKEFYETGKKLKIQMRQVNCVESGDLCERENIFSYPSLYIYTPAKDDNGALIPGKLKFVDTYPRTLLRTAENVQKFMKKAVVEYDSGLIDMPSSSELLDTDTMLKLVAGDISEMYFVGFFPTTDQEYKEIGNSNVQSRCIDCVETKQMWDKLLNRVLSTVRTGHFNCRENPNTCKELGFTELTSSLAMAHPKFAVFLPARVGLIRMDYKGDLTMESMKAYADRVYENYQFEKLSLRGIMDVMEYHKDLPQKPLDQYYPLQNKIAVVFFYDPATVTEEDQSILPYLLEYVTNSPFNMYVYTAKHDKIQTNIETQAQNLVNYVHYDQSQPVKEFNREMFLASTITTKPTIFVMRDNTLFTSVFQSFAPEDVRSVEKVTAFLDANKYPLYQELTPELLPAYFTKDKKLRDNKVVVTFIDSNDAKYTNEAFYNMSLAAHEYHLLKQEYLYNQMVIQREDKDARVQALKKNNEEAPVIIAEMRKKVPNFFGKLDVVFTFVDVSKSDKFKYVRGWKIDPKKYKIGDTIVLSKDNRYLWEKDGTGRQLINQPAVIKSLLMSFVDNKVSLAYRYWLVTGSPYGGILLWMDYVHDYGLVGYLVLIGVLYAAFVGLKRRKTKARRDTVGILGAPKKD